MSGEPPLILRMSLFYDSHEDRIMIASKLAIGETALLKLTRRLLDNLIPHLLKVEAEMMTRISVSGDAGDHSLGEPSEKSEEAVVIGSSFEDILVCSVDVSTSPDHIILDWKNDFDLKKARLILSAATLSEWLRAMRECFKRGAWSEAAWNTEPIPPAVLDWRRLVTIH